MPFYSKEGKAKFDTSLFFRYTQKPCVGNCKNKGINRWKLEIKSYFSYCTHLKLNNDIDVHIVWYWCACFNRREKQLVWIFFFTIFFLFYFRHAASDFLCWYLHSYCYHPFSNSQISYDIQNRCWNPCDLRVQWKQAYTFSTFASI